MPEKRILRDKDRKFRLLFQDNPQPMWVFETETFRILEANRAASALYGYSLAEFQNLAISEVQTPEEFARFVKELGTANSVTGIWRHRTSTNRLIDVEIAVHEIQYGGAQAQLAVLLDITGRHELEEQLRQAQKMEVVGMLAGGVAHDFSNLLTIISGYGQLILKNLGPDDPNRHSAEQIVKAGERAAALTRQLLAFSRRQVLQPKVLELNKLITGLSSMLQRLIGEDVDLQFALSPDLGRVSADPSQIEQVLMNLVVNGRDAMPKGGVLTVETSNGELDENYANRHVAVKPGPYIQLAVSDTGTGMDAATKARLFEPFFTTKPVGSGTGLGLSTVFGIVKQSGGSVEVYSEPGRGTCVKVYLPRIDQPVPVEAEQRKKQLAPGSETILLAEDDEMVRALVREALHREGYRVIESADPLELRRLASEHRGVIHLLIADVVMPRLGGRDLAEQIRAVRPGMKVLYMSGYTGNALLHSGVLQHDVAFLQKPFTPAALIEKVHEVLEGNDGNKARKAGK
jgi:two-component system cell cycle sensor histidine kinase/response regulator CckA